MKTRKYIRRFSKALTLCLAMGLPSIGAADAGKVTLDVGIDRPLLLVDSPQTVHLRIALRGFAMDEAWDRSPLNVAIVLDKSGSMSGPKLEAAKEAAIMALQRLGDRDIVSIITYDSTVDVLVPATRLRGMDDIIAAIHGIQAGGNTALFAGVSKGAAEVRKFLDAHHINRILLLSDGKANVGPSSPDALARLGASLGHEEIPVTTIGLGLDYNEDLMSRLAMRSDGYHYFAQEAGELAEIFDDELGRALSVVAQAIRIEVRCAPGVRPVHFLGREAEIDDRIAVLTLNNLFSDDERRAILEIEVSPRMATAMATELATVSVVYENLATRTQDRLRRDLSIGFTDSGELAEQSVNEQVMIDVVRLIGVEQNMLASALRSEGRVAEALEVLLSNSAYLSTKAIMLESEVLEEYAAEQKADAEKLEEKDWDEQGKVMREAQVKSLY